MENEEIKKAREELEKISEDKHERYLAELRQKHIMDTNAVEELGFDKGLAQGEKKSKITIAKKLKEENVDINIISKATELTIEEINNL